MQTSALYRARTVPRGGRLQRTHAHCIDTGFVGCRMWRSTCRHRASPGGSLPFCGATAAYANLIALCGWQVTCTFLRWCSTCSLRETSSRAIASCRPAIKASLSAVNSAAHQGPLLLAARSPRLLDRWYDRAWRRRPYLLLVPVTVHSHVASSPVTKPGLNSGFRASDYADDGGQLNASLPSHIASCHPSPFSTLPSFLVGPRDRLFLASRLLSGPRQARVPSKSSRIVAPPLRPREKRGQQKDSPAPPGQFCFGPGNPLLLPLTSSPRALLPLTP